jgi:tyrosine-protein kinase Etk/Wzc
MLDVVNEKFNRKELKNISFVLNYLNQRGTYGYGYGYGVYVNGYHENEKKEGVFIRVQKLLKGLFNSK